jgi:hypothetical protein
MGLYSVQELHYFCLFIWCGLMSATCPIYRGNSAKILKNVLASSFSASVRIFTYLFLVKDNYIDCDFAGMKFIFQVSLIINASRNDDLGFLI